MNIMLPSFKANYLLFRPQKWTVSFRQKIICLLMEFCISTEQIFSEGGSRSCRDSNFENFFVTTSEYKCLTFYFFILTWVISSSSFAAWEGYLKIANNKGNKRHRKIRFQIKAACPKVCLYHLFQLVIRDISSTTALLLTVSRDHRSCNSPAGESVGF